jgi:hypothetical protein
MANGNREWDCHFYFLLQHNTFYLYKEGCLKILRNLTEAEFLYHNGDKSRSSFPPCYLKSLILLPPEKKVV